MPVDHYAALGAAPDADPERLRRAYLAVMRACHPDLRPGDAAAAERARRANEAWAVLGDASRRAAYDRQLLARGGRPPAAVDAGRATPAYGHRRRSFSREFHRACVKVGAAVFAAGLVLLGFTG